MWQNKLSVHAGKAHPHTVTVSSDFIVLNQMKQTPYPLDSPGLAPVDFFLFSHIKRKPMECHAESLSELLVRV
jgi:hypothetical protein